MMRVVAIAAALAVGVLVLMSGETNAMPATIDFSSHGHGPFDSDFFDSVHFTESGNFVGFIQGDDALVSGSDLPHTVAGTFSTPIDSLSGLVALSVQGTVLFTLTALDDSSSAVASVSREITQDLGDPNDMGFGYHAIELGPFTSPAESFVLTGTFVRSSHAFTQIGYGVSSLTFTSVAEPESFLILCLGLVGLGYPRRRRASR